MSLREVAEKLQISKEMKAWNIGTKIADSDVACLLNAVVEKEEQIIQYTERLLSLVGFDKTKIHKLPKSWALRRFFRLYSKT